MDITPLENLGLTNAEIKVYLTLLETGQTKVGQIIKKTDLQSSVVHNAINKLQDKGLVSYIKKGQIKHYNATDPKNFMDFIEEKKKNFQKILPELLLKQKLAKERNEGEVYEGRKGIMNLLLEFIKDSKKGEEYLFFSADIEPINKEIQDFYKKYDPKRKAKGLIVKGIAPLKLKPYFIDRMKKRMVKIKFSKQPLPPNMAVFRDKVVLVTWGEKPVGYLLHSKQMAEKYREFFNVVWNQLP